MEQRAGYDSLPEMIDRARNAAPMKLSFLVVPIWPWGQVNIKWDRNSLYSERNGGAPSIVMFGMRLTWRRWRATV